MSGFYVSLIFVGILLVLISIILILIDKKNVFIFRKTFDDKKQELVEIINDAEQMIDELNRFSDYIVSQIDAKNEELNVSIKGAEKKISALKNKATAISKTINATSRKAIKDDSDDTVIETKNSMAGEATKAQRQSDTGSVLPQKALNNPVAAVEAYSRSKTMPSKTIKNRGDKVIPFNSKHSEVLRLSKQGMEGTEIAKSLNMGKGEVELIIGLRG